MPITGLPSPPSGTLLPVLPPTCGAGIGITFNQGLFTDFHEGNEETVHAQGGAHLQASDGITLLRLVGRHFARRLAVLATGFLAGLSQVDRADRSDEGIAEKIAQADIEADQEGPFRRQVRKLFLAPNTPPTTLVF